MTLVFSVIYVLVDLIFVLIAFFFCVGVYRTLPRTILQYSLKNGMYDCKWYAVAATTATTAAPITTARIV